MRIPRHPVLALTLAVAAMNSAAQGQAGHARAATAHSQAASLAKMDEPSSARSLPHSGGSIPPPPPLFELKPGDYKFSLDTMMRTLRDRSHEGWVLAAYPDPATTLPLIGAGFGLNVPATDHPQKDPLNPHSFREPSSAALWQAAGLDPARLQKILVQYQHELATWKIRKFRRKIRAHALRAQVTDTEAMRLLRISSLQAISNARAYCRYFNQLTASQQMGLSELVFQMGVNLEQFTGFLAVINRDDDLVDLLAGASMVDIDSDRWELAKQTLADSKWARQYRTRAVLVIAKFDPE